jgi:hypothetical protein
MRRWRTVGAGVVLVTLLVAVWQLVDELSELSVAVRKDVGAVLARRDVPPASGDLTFVTHQPSLCCEDFYDGARRAMLGALLIGIPLALMAYTSLLITGRHPAKPWLRSIGGLLRAGFVLQWSSLMVTAMVTLPFLLTAFTEVVSSWQGIYLVVTLIANVVALPAWRAAALAARPLVSPRIFATSHPAS